MFFALQETRFDSGETTILCLKNDQNTGIKHFAIVFTTTKKLRCNQRKRTDTFCINPEHSGWTPFPIRTQCGHFFISAFQFVDGSSNFVDDS